jgi:hypothetical protein
MKQEAGSTPPRALGRGPGPRRTLGKERRKVSVPQPGAPRAAGCLRWIAPREEGSAGGGGGLVGATARQEHWDAGCVLPLTLEWVPQVCSIG